MICNAAGQGIFSLSRALTTCCCRVRWPSCRNQGSDKDLDGNGMKHKVLFFQGGSSHPLNLCCPTLNFQEKQKSSDLKTFFLFILPLSMSPASLLFSAESKTLEARHSLRSWMQVWVPQFSSCCLDFSFFS